MDIWEDILEILLCAVSALGKMQMRVKSLALESQVGKEEICL